MGVLAPVLPFVGAAVIGAVCALGATAVSDARSGAQRSPEEYFKAALKGSLVGMVASANPALVIGAAAAGLSLLLSGCGRTEELPEDAEEGGAEALPENTNADEDDMGAADEAGIKENSRSVSEELIAFLKSYETGADRNGKFLPQGEPALSPYHGSADPPSVRTIGWGYAMWGSEMYTLRDGREVDLYDWNTVITVDDAEDILRKAVRTREVQLNDIYDRYDRTVSQRQYDAIFSIYYQNSPKYFTNPDEYSMARWIAHGDLNDFEIAKYLWGDFAPSEDSNSQEGIMRRRTDELDILSGGDYTREYDTTRYGDIWRKDFTWYPDDETR
jgi:GH24 family phage-related lysozyme (muramidase)